MGGEGGQGRRQPASEMGGNGEQGRRQPAGEMGGNSEQGRPQGSPPRIHPTPARTKTTTLPRSRYDWARIKAMASKGDRKGPRPASTPPPPVQRLRGLPAPGGGEAVSLYGRGRKRGVVGTLAVALARAPLSCALSACSRLPSCLVRSLATSPCCPLVFFFSLRYTTRAMNGHISDRRAA